MSPRIPKWFEDAIKRDERCKEKDKVLIPLIKRVAIKDPKKFHAVLMPNIQGSGLDELGKRRVPNHNVFAVERDRGVHHTQSNPHPIYNANLVGIRTTPRASNLSAALDHIHAVIRKESIKLDLIYLDFYARAGFEHLESAEKIFGLKMLKKHGTIIITLGTNRSNKVKADFQAAIEKITGGSVAQFLIGMWSDRCGYGKPKVDEREYRSSGGNNPSILYTTSAFYF